MSWYIDVLKKFAVFSGRAGRAEFWWFFLFNIIVSIGLAVVDTTAGLYLMEGVGILGTLYSLAVILPSIGVGIRRLHDTGRSGWWMLLTIIPCVGIVVLVLCALPGQDGDNDYGPVPAERAGA